MKMSNERLKLKGRIRELEEELERKNAVLALYGDHRNWVQPSAVRTTLGIPSVDRSGRPVEDPHQCFVGARYAWEPALKVMLGAEFQEKQA